MNAQNMLFVPGEVVLIVDKYYSKPYGFIMSKAINEDVSGYELFDNKTIGLIMGKYKDYEHHCGVLVNNIIYLIRLDFLEKT